MKDPSNVLLNGSWETSASVIKYIKGVKTLVKANPKTLKLFNEKKANYKKTVFNDRYKKTTIEYKPSKNDIFLTRNKSAYINRKKSNFNLSNLQVNRIYLKLFNFHIVKNRTETEKIFNIQDIEKEFEARYNFLKRFTNYFETSNSINKEPVKNQKIQKIPKKSTDLSNNIHFLNKVKKKMKHYGSMSIPRLKTKKLLGKNNFENDNNNSKKENDTKNLLVQNELRISNNEKPNRAASAMNLKSRKNMLNFQILGLHNNSNDANHISYAEIKKHNNNIIRNKIKTTLKTLNQNKINRNISAKEMNNFLNIRQIPNFKSNNKKISPKNYYQKEADKFHSVDEIIYRNGNSFENSERLNNNSINENNSFKNNSFKNISFKNNNINICSLFKKQNKTFDKACNANVSFFEIEPKNEVKNKMNKELLKKRKNTINKNIYKANCFDSKYLNDSQNIKNFDNTKQFFNFFKKNYSQVIIMDK